MMKRTLIFAILLCVLGSLLAGQNSEVQSRAERLIERHRQNLSNNRTLFRNSGTANLRSPLLEQIIIQSPDWDEPEIWVNDEKLSFFYDEQGRLSEIHWQEWELEEFDGEWADVYEKATINWQEDNLIDTIVYSFKYWDFDEEESFWLDMYVQTQQYNETDQIVLLEMEYFDFDYEDWVEEGNVVFNYDEDDILAEIIFSWSVEDEEWREYEITKVSFEYDENGRFQNIYDEYFEDEEWHIEGMSTLEYHHSDETTYSDVQNFVNELSLFMSHFWYINRNPFGKVLSETWHVWVEEEWFHIDREISHYNEQDYLVSTVYEDYEYFEEEWTAYSRTLYDYDEDWNVVEILDQWRNEQDDIWINWDRGLLSYREVTNVEEITLSPGLISIGNYPNPFNPETAIMFNLPNSQHITINLFNIRGQVVKNLADGVYETGQHKIVWDGRSNDGSGLSSGVYFYRLDTSGASLTGKMMMLK